MICIKSIFALYCKFVASTLKPAKTLHVRAYIFHLWHFSSSVSAVFLITLNYYLTITKIFSKHQEIFALNKTLDLSAHLLSEFIWTHTVGCAGCQLLLLYCFRNILQTKAYLKWVLRDWNELNLVGNVNIRVSHLLHIIRNQQYTPHLFSWKKLHFKRNVHNRKINVSHVFRLLSFMRK